MIKPTALLVFKAIILKLLKPGLQVALLTLLVQPLVVEIVLHILGKREPCLAISVGGFLEGGFLCGALGVGSALADGTIGVAKAL